MGRVSRFVAATATALIAATAALGLPGAAAPSHAGSLEAYPPRVTMITDSVGGALFWVARARQELAKGLDFKLETKSCRKLVSPGCFAYEEVPPSALETVEKLGPELGFLVIVNVGYNDIADGYGAGIDAVARALTKAGVTRIVWVTLREWQPNWVAINNEIRAAANRWPELTVAEWAPVAAGEPSWFVDGAHMNELGAMGFARFLRPIVLQVCGAACVPPAPMATMLAPVVVRHHRAMLRWTGDEYAMTFDVGVQRQGGAWRTVASRIEQTSFGVQGVPGSRLRARVRARDADGTPGAWSQPSPFRL